MKSLPPRARDDIAQIKPNSETALPTANEALTGDDAEKISVALKGISTLSQDYTRVLLGDLLGKVVCHIPGDRSTLKKLGLDEALEKFLKEATVFLVDDDNSTRRAFQRTLSGNLKITNLVPFEKAQDVLDTIQGKNGDPKIPHLIVTDVNMPEMGGVELFQQVRSLNLPNQPLFLAATGNPDPKNIMGLLEGGVPVYVKGDPSIYIQAMALRLLRQHPDFTRSLEK